MKITGKDVKRLLLLNLPYILIALFSTNLGEAYLHLKSTFSITTIQEKFIFNTGSLVTVKIFLRSTENRLHFIKQPRKLLMNVDFRSFQQQKT